MAINKAVKVILKALSYDSMNFQTERRLAELKKLDPMRILTQKLDVQILNGDCEVPVRIYFPSEKIMEEKLVSQYNGKVLLFLHGGGWVTESVETYDRVCAQMAQSTGQLVLSVEYRRAPEHRFPIPLMDSYAVARTLYRGEFLREVRWENVTVIGDSAGGNMAAALSLLARDQKEFIPARQILIYPAVWNDYTEASPFPSVKENGRDYLLTSGKMEEYLRLYQNSPSDRRNPYFAPLLAKDLGGLPRTLILTAQYDPLRDEAEEFGQQLRAAGNEVQVERIANALHGFFALGIKHNHVQESFDIINEFLKGV